MSEVISVDGVPIYYEIHGDGPLPLIFVHGWSCDHSYWKEQVSHFAQSYKVVTMDLGGHGKSGHDRDLWTIPAFGQDVAAVIDKLGAEQVVLIGHSMAGSIVIEAANQMPNRVLGIVAVDSLRNIEQVRTKEEVAEFVAPFHANFVDATSKFVRSMFVAESDPELVEQIVANMTAARPEVATSALQEVMLNNQHLRATLLKMTILIALINSDYKPYDFQSAQKYGIAISMMSGIGHFVMIEDAKTFNRLLDTVIRRCKLQKGF